MSAVNNPIGPCARHVPRVLVTATQQCAQEKCRARSDLLCEIIGQKNEALVERCKALVPGSSKSPGQGRR
jgi:hypothetical protein